jgi:hypothetical protein
MPAYSYKERFVPFILDGSKPHTIRERRRKVAKPGDMLYHYYGLRTKWCTKLCSDKCKDVKTIIIGDNRIIFLFNTRLTDQQLNSIWTDLENMNLEYRVLSTVEKDQLAWLDGFRSDGSDIINTGGCFDLMFRYWKQTSELPFIGDIIYRDLSTTKIFNTSIVKKQSGNSINNATIIPL